MNLIFLKISFYNQHQDQNQEFNTFSGARPRLSHKDGLVFNQKTKKVRPRMHLFFKTNTTSRQNKSCLGIGFAQNGINTLLNMLMRSFYQYFTWSTRKFGSNLL